jgi:hypothetical protein
VTSSSGAVESLVADTEKFGHCCRREHGGKLPRDLASPRRAGRAEQQHGLPDVTGGGRQSTVFPAVAVRDVTLTALRSHYFMAGERVTRLRGREEGPMRMHEVGAWRYQPGLSRTVPEFGRVLCPPVSS